MKFLHLSAAAVAVSLAGAWISQAQAADPGRGAALYAECQGCHSLRENMMGPRHCWVVGRPAARVPDFNYSDAMKNSGLTWDDATLDKFLTTPFAFLPGTSMGYAGVYDQKDRDDLIAYLGKITSDAQACAGIDKLR
jgi:cytochrome c